MDWSFALILELKQTDGGKALDSLRELLASPPWPDVDTWGTDPQAQRASQAMADLTGGPAPPRKDE